MRLIADIPQQVERADRNMRRNQKLTKVIAGRTIMAVTTEPGGVLILFDNESKMKIKTAGPATIPSGGKVKSVHEAKAQFKIEFEDGSCVTFLLADPGSSVAVRDKNKAVEYLG
jgi:coenzyme F420-reducing hydrogenase alpha subunit